MPYLTKMREWALKFKLVQMFGNKCQRCGYDDLSCLAAFDFHHRDKTTKLFSINKSINKGYSWTEILEEANKCDLLCAVCHRKAENPNRCYGDPELLFNDFVRKQRSPRRAEIRQTAWGIPSKEQLCELLEQYSLAIIAKMYGKATTTVMSWKSTYGLRIMPVNRPKIKPSADELRQLIVEKSAGQIAMLYEVSDKAVKKWLVKYGIENPRGKIFYKPTVVFHDD